MIKDRPIFVREDRETQAPGTVGSYAPRGGASSRGGGGGSGKRVYVGNLSWDCKWQDLKDHMRSVGEVLHADVLIGPDGKSKGCALVEYQSVAEAKRAIEELTDTEIFGRKIFVREDRVSAR